SMHAILDGLSRANGCDWTVLHQTEQGLVTQACEDAILRGDLTRAREVYSNWTHQIEVSGNNNAFLMPVMREVFGDDLKIIRLRREPEAHFKSFRTGPQVSPEVWGGYHGPDSDYDGPLYWWSPTPVWFGEQSEAEWEALTTDERIRWYADTLNTWMDREADGFEQRIDVRTEDLSDPETVDRIARFVDPSWTERVEPVHKNRRAMFDYAQLSVEEAKEARRLFEHFDFKRVLSEPDYLLAWALEKALEATDRPAELLLDLERELRQLRGDYQRAQGEIEQLGQALRRNPSDRGAFRGLMERLLVIDRPTDALRLASQWLSQNEDFEEGLELAARAADRLEDAESAARFRRRARTLAR
ncbi:MAG: hypothetical protein AAFZ65_17620, partial [Planctomycetota bacterium]